MINFSPIVMDGLLLQVWRTNTVSFQLGLDTGGTYTDAVLIDDQQNVVATAKSLTTHHDLILGLRGAAVQVLAGGHQPVTLVSLSTTLATNALVEGRGRPVCLVLIGYRQQQLKRARLHEALGGDPHGFIAGGHTASGQAVCELDLAALTTLVDRVAESVDAFAVSSLFAVRNPAHEIQARDLIIQRTGKAVTCGHELSSGLDAPRRALTTLLNARLIPMIRSLLVAARQLLTEQSVNAPLMVVKGDGTLVSADVAEQSPVETILSGPAASVVGAQFLCSEPLVLVSDMGGTTTDVAMIRNGSPRLNPDGATVGGWRTMVEAIAVQTFGLGGDSRILFDREDRDFSVGPERVMPLSRLIHEHPELKDDLHAQLELPFSTTHSAEFVLSHAAEAIDLTLQQQELWDQIEARPIAVQSLFKDQTLDRALVRLTQRGIVLRAGFTPSDACHLVGEQTLWDVEGAELGALLLMRCSEQNFGKRYDSTEHFARDIIDSVSRHTAMALLESVVAEGIGASTNDKHKLTGLSHSQKALLADTFHADDEALLKISAMLGMPIVGLGAPVASFYPASAALLGTTAILPQQGNVANALGAVVSVVRQQQHVVITPAGGNKVQVHFNDNLQVFDNLEAGAASAIEWAEQQAQQYAHNAGAADITISHTREDNVVENDGQQVFFESHICATAVGRPSSIVR